MRGRWAHGLLVLTVFALATGTVGARFALCVGPDGHRAVELVEADCCNMPADHAAERHRACSEACVDTPLGLWLELPAKDPAGVSMTAPVSASFARAVSPSPYVARVTRSSWIERGDLLHRPLSTLSSVLRC